MSLEDYHSLEETAYLLRSPNNAQRLLESIAELEAESLSSPCNLTIPKVLPILLNQLKQLFFLLFHQSQIEYLSFFYLLIHLLE
jgi:hypothetical protein